MRISMTPIGWPLAVALAATTLGALPAAAPAQQTTSDGGNVVQLGLGRGRLVNLASPMTDVFVADSNVADVQVRSPRQLYVFAKKPGETMVSATTRSGAVVYASTVRVGNNIDTLAQMLRLAMPDAQVTATTLNGLVLLTGTVAGPGDAAEAERLVSAFVGEGTKVISRLRTATPLQVNLQVKFAEVSRSFVKNIGVNTQTFDGTGGFKFGLGQGRSQSQYAPLAGPSSNTGLFTGGSSTPSAGSTGVTTGGVGSTLAGAGRLLGLDILGSLDLGETLGQVTTLAQPNLTALSGETGSFLAGGEIPIPIAQALGLISVEYKQYGVSLAYTPTVLSDGRISLRVRPEVSQLSSEGAVTLNGTTIPALTTRRAETTVELGSGQSFMIAGLLQNSNNNSIQKTPGLGDVPILGSLFRSNGFQRNETELVIVITPYLVKPVNANDIVLPTDGYKAPTDLGRVFLGQLGNGTSGGDRPKPSMAPATTAGAAPAIGAVAPVAPAPAPDARADDRKAAPPRKARKSSGVAPGFSN